VGKGVCGSAAEQRQTLVVANVHEFPGHIACDSASNSEIVLPIIRNGTLIGVLDIDSPEFARFDDHDKIGLEKFVEILTTAIGRSAAT
jgi:L-methionine (R)-S-oxide reductase